MNDREEFRRKMKFKGEIAIQNVQKTVRQILENPDGGNKTSRRKR